MKTEESIEWSISPFPDGYSFGFTIVHDADNSSSKRLEPLFSVFDEFDIKVSLTAFAFWPEETKQKKSWIENKDNYLGPVPLEVEDECDFYKKLSNSGHEVGLHTASDKTDTREKTIKAFEFFFEKFGHYPKIYVEHRDSDNLECLQKEGNNPDSEYYIVDVLNKYGSWNWIIGPSGLPYEGKGDYFNVLSKVPKIFNDHLIKLWGTLKQFIKNKCWDPKAGDEYLEIMNMDSPFDTYVLKKYGIVKGFRRSGKRENSSGDGFLVWYSKKNIDKLEKNGGLALVYTHMNTKWLNSEKSKMREDIKNRLEYIKNKNVWLAPAGVMLDRLRDQSNIHLSYSERWLKVINAGNRRVSGLTLISHNKQNALIKNKKRFELCDKNKIVIGDIKEFETLTFFFEKI